MITVSLKIACVALIVKLAEADVFSALVDIDPLLDTHKKIMDSIENYLLMEKQRLKIVNNLLDHYKRHYKSMKKDPNYIENPFNAFTLIKRLTSDLALVDFYANNTLLSFNNDSVGFLPTNEDLVGASSALLRIQKTYDLNVTELSQGIIRGTYSHGSKPYVEKISPMSSSDLFELGKRAYEEDDFTNAIVWLKESINRFKSKPDSEIVNFDEADIIDWIREAYEWLGDFRNAITWTKELIFLRPDYEDAKDQLIEYRRRLIQNEVFLNANIEQSLCRGDRPLPSNVTKSLHCFYKSGPEPFLLLARIKTELMYLDPAVYLFHDVITDDEIQTLQHLSKSKLERSEVDDGGMAFSAPYRVSKTAWFEDEESDIAAGLSRRVMHFTDLDMETSEPLQVVNYGIGGHYEAHYDFFKDTEIAPETGHRVATVLFYMSDVEQGGATTFTEFGLTVFPIKNSAIFWMNLLPSGKLDLRTRHAACPVLRGSKWVCNKWIHERGQEFRRPCDLEFENSAPSHSI